jgi:hypothetical protein
VLPDFVILGGPRCGTSSLFHYLLSHSDVVGPPKKELHFVDLEHNVRRGARWYRSWFPTRAELEAAAPHGPGGRALTGEGTPNYLAHPDAPARLRAVVPDARLIVVMRNPIDRAWSQYRWSRQADRETLTFEAALRVEAERLPGGFDMMRDPRQRERFVTYSYLTRGLYAEQLTRWFDVFPREQFVLLRSEDLYEDPGPACARVCAHLGLSVPAVALPHANAGVDQGAVDPVARAWMAERLVEPNERLSELTEGTITWR